MLEVVLVADSLNLWTAVDTGNNIDCRLELHEHHFGKGLVDKDLFAAMELLLVLFCYHNTVQWTQGCIGNNNFRWMVLDSLRLSLEGFVRHINIFFFIN